MTVVFQKNCCFFNLSMQIFIFLKLSVFFDLWPKICNKHESALFDSKSWNKRLTKGLFPYLQNSKTGHKIGNKHVPVIFWVAA